MNKYLIIISIVLPLIYILLGFKRKRNKKKILIKRLIFGFIFCLILNLVNFLFLKKEDKPVSDVTRSTSTTITTTSEVTSTTATTKKDTTTTSKTTSTKKSTTTTKASANVTSKGYDIKYTDGAYYIGGYLIANKTYFLDSKWVPKNTHKTITESMGGFCRECIDEEAYKAWTEMKNDAAALGYKLWNQSGYRSYDYQKDLYNGYVKRNGQAAADKSSARAGASEHQTGLAFDLNNIETAFKDKPEGIWVNNNAYLYGYIIRYPEGKSDETGYKFEPWHIRYVGKDLAKKLYNDGDWITMESYFGITSKYSE